MARIVAIDIGDSGSAVHSRSLSLRSRAAIMGYQVWLAVAWKIGGRLEDRMAQTN